MATTKPNYKKLYKKYHSSRKAKTERNIRNQNRRRAKRAGTVHKGDGKEIDHIKPLSKGGSNNKSNLRIVSRKTNRSKKDRPIPRRK
jgi:5-methylcytosine-specific restriction endonuclease McrA